MTVASIYQRYRAWEHRHIELLDALDAGRAPPLDWEGSRYGRRTLATYRAMTPAERRALREFIWRWRGWRSWAAIAGWAIAATAAGVVLHLALPREFGAVKGIVFANLVAFGFGLAVIGVWFNPRALRGRKSVWGKAAAAGLAGVLTGLATRSLLEGGSFRDVLQSAAPKLVTDGVPMLVGLFVVVAGVALWRNRELDAENARLAADAERTRLANELSASRLRLVQAQIEPHFLFNTLGAVQQLAERGAPQAAALTAHLIRFLRGALAGLRAERTTLGDEFEMVDGYLRVMQVRLGPRLAYALELPAALRDAPMLPTVLVTLVENAIKHGIEPSPQGGRIDVRASLATPGAADTTVVVEVIDTGAGMPALPGNGNGLASVRDQLALAYAGRASLELLDNEPHGLVARVRLPWRRATSP